MKKIFFPGVLLALLFVFSCTKDQFTEEEAQKSQQDLISYQDSIDQANQNTADSLNQVRDSLAMIGGIIQYSVSVIPVDGGTGFVNKSVEKTNGLAGAIVSVSQHGVLLTATTDESGIAVFNDLRVGSLNVHVRAEDYTTVNFIVDILIQTTDQAINDVVVSATGTTINGKSVVLRHAATMVPVFSLTKNTSNISGVVTYDTDLTNLVPENAAGATVIALVDVDDAIFRTNYFEPVGTATTAFNVLHAPITQIAYAELVATAVTDANGAYSLEIPSASDGLPIKMEVSDIAVDQDLVLTTLYGQKVFGVQSVRTIFGTSGATPTAIPSVPAAYVTFAAPTGTLTQQPLVTATATAIIGESGIASIIITNQGNGYTQAPILKINGDGEDAEAVAFISQGKVTSVEITNPGQGYSTATVAVLAFGTDYGTVATATPTISYGITSYTTTPGSGYQSTPEVVITSSSGSGASASAVMSGYVSKINVLNMGSGYTCPPSVQIERGTGTLATATPTMTVYNPIHSIELNAVNYTATFETTPSVLITKFNNGSGATAVAQLKTDGEINDIVLANAGLGYTEAPTVLIIGGGGMGAVAQAILNTLDGSISISILESGSGYTSDPTIQISAPPTGGTAPVVDHVVRVFAIDKITITNAGSGYDIVYNNSAADDYDNEANVIIDGSPLADNQVVVRPDMKVESIAVVAAGTDYPVPPMVTITPKCGYGSGATAVTEILFTVKKIDVVEKGSGYNVASDVVVTVVTPPEGCLTQATAAAVLGAGALESVAIVIPGAEYTAPPAVYLRKSSVRIQTLNASVLEGEITSITFDAIENSNLTPGSYDIQIVVVETAAVFGTQAYPQSGKISFVSVVNPGAGYTTEPIVKFQRVNGSGASVETGGFIDAEATAVIADGRVVSIDITNTGTGYYYPPQISVVIPDYLEQAKGTVTISVDGYITGVTLTGGTNSKGFGYASAPNVTFTTSFPGMGAGAAGTAVIKDGKVEKVVMTNNGSGYLGKNTPTSAVGAGFKPNGAALTMFQVWAGKSYVKDIYLGTGVRNEDSN